MNYPFFWTYPSAFNPCIPCTQKLIVMQHEIDVLNEEVKELKRRIDEMTNSDIGIVVDNDENP